MKVIDIARTCHEANRVLCETNGDDSQQPWELAEDWQRDSAVEGVLFFKENPNAPDSAQHDAWMRDKFDNGWVYGEIKDSDAKTHPCLVPFPELSAVNRAKDTLFRAVCSALIPLVD